MTSVRLLLLSCLLATLPVQAGKLTTGQESDDTGLLPAGEAFILGVERQADDSLVLHWTIAPGYYLYRDRMEFELVDAGGATLGEPRFAPAENKQDPFFGETAVYYDEASVRLPLEGEPPPGASLRLTWQGCNEPQGVCYPPVEDTLALSAFTTVGASPPSVSEQGRIATILADSGLAWTVLAFVGFGMGISLLLVGACAGHLLPRAGAWMQPIRIALGIALLAVAIWLLDRILPPALIMALWGVLLIGTGVQLGALTGMAVRPLQRLWKALGLVALLYGALLLVGAAGGGTSVLQPLRGVFSDGAPAPSVASEFQPVNGLEGVRRALAEARERGQPVMLDVYADWCVACKELEAFTFPDARVRQSLNGVMLLRADVTANDASDRALLQRFDLYGPPAVMFFGPDGVERRGGRLVGFVGPGAFARHVRNVLPETES